MRDPLIQILDKFPARTIAVVGDLIADQFLYGHIARISREAPVLVLHYREFVSLPGGAANAANNLLDLGCRVKVAGAVGRDQAGRELIRTLSRKGADVRLVMKDRSYATPMKTRILAGAHYSSSQQVVRLDRISQLDSNIHLPLAELRAALRSCHGIILSDYGYGMVVPALVFALKRVAEEKGIPLVVDSRFRMTDFHGVTSITPNISELEEALGLAIGNDPKLLHRAGQQVIRRQKLHSLLVTQGRYGMTLLQPRRAPVHIPVYGSDEVADVTGAGDTVIAVFTLALACGSSSLEAARLANFAGGLVVMKRGTATTTREELRVALLAHSRSQSDT